jgi:hypothetical protein
MSCRNDRSSLGSGSYVASDDAWSLMLAVKTRLCGEGDFRALRRLTFVLPIAGVEEKTLSIAGNEKASPAVRKQSLNYSAPSNFS